MRTSNACHCDAAMGGFDADAVSTRSRDSTTDRYPVRTAYECDKFVLSIIIASSSGPAWPAKSQLHVLRSYGPKLKELRSVIRVAILSVWHTERAWREGNGNVSTTPDSYSYNMGALLHNLFFGVHDMTMDGIIGWTGVMNIYSC